jgi:hypothetical protein
MPAASASSLAAIGTPQPRMPSSARGRAPSSCRPPLPNFSCCARADAAAHKVAGDTPRGRVAQVGRGVVRSVSGQQRRSSPAEQARSKSPLLAEANEQAVPDTRVLIGMLNPALPVDARALKGLLVRRKHDARASAITRVTTPRGGASAGTRAWMPCRPGGHGPRKRRCGSVPFAGEPTAEPLFIFRASAAISDPANHSDLQVPSTPMARDSRRRSGSGYAFAGGGSLQVCSSDLQRVVVHAHRSARGNRARGGDHGHRLHLRPDQSSRGTSPSRAGRAAREVGAPAPNAARYRIPESRSVRSVGRTRIKPARCSLPLHEAGVVSTSRAAGPEASASTRPRTQAAAGATLPKWRLCRSEEVSAQVVVGARTDANARAAGRSLFRLEVSDRYARARG